MYRNILALALVTSGVGFTHTATAQQVIVIESSALGYSPVYSGVPAPCSIPMDSTGPVDPYFRSPFETRFPRTARVLQVIADPTLAVQNRQNYAWNQPSDHPVLDAAPPIASIAFFALSLGASGAMNTVGMFVPAAIRLLRVVLYGSPLPGNRADTLLWVALPTVARIRLANKESGGLFNPPLIQRPFLPWRRNAAHCR